MPHFRSALAVTALALAASSALASDATTKAFELPNGLRVLIESDPDLDRSAAALSVRVGSMDNGDQIGIAHFLEHMLFLGTEKYPDPADYKDYLAQNDGRSNAYTAEDLTNYHFEIRNEAFEGALDRFSHFFIDPLMTDALSEREVNAVDSEHSKNLENEFWRTRQVYRSLLNPEHPQATFTTGNSQTLAGVKNEALRAFYEATYSANLMNLSIVSAHPLAAIEAWVREKFSAIPNRGHQALDVGVPLYHDGLRGHLVEVRALQDVHDLWVRFEVPAVAFDYRSKPAGILGGILGHEGPESLLQRLKADGLATSLSAGGQNVGSQGTFNLTLTLTPQGSANVDAVLERIFGMINHLRSLPELPDYVLEQRQKMAEIELRFREPGVAFDEARWRAAAMTRYPYDDLLRSVYLIPEPSQAAIRSVLDVMTPENAVVLVASKDRETDQVEPYYQTEFRVTQLGDERMARLRAAAPAEGMGLPAPNPFIPTNFDLVETTHAETPWVHRFEYGEAWLRHDTIFRQPKVALEVVLYNDDNWTSPREFVLGNLYAAAVRLAMNPHSYPLTEAGVSIAVSSERRGITLTAGGYSDKIPELAGFVVPYLKNLQIDEAQFQVVKAGMARGLANFDKAAPSAQAFEVFRELIREVHFTPAQQAAALESITRDDLAAYFGRVHDALRVRAFAYGNMSEEALTRTVDTLVSGLAPARALADSERYDGRVIKLAKGADAILRRPIDAPDGITMLLYQGAPADRTERAALSVLAASFPPGFYGDLRTLQQTGYIVQSGAFEVESLPLAFLLSQSSVVSTDSLRGRFVAHVAHYLDDLDAMTDEEFDAMRGSAISELSKKSTSFEDELARNTRLAFEYKDLADTDKQIAALTALTRTQWIEIVRRVLGSEARRVSIQLDGRTDRHRFQEKGMDEIRQGAEGWHRRGDPAEPPTKDEAPAAGDD